MCVQYREESGYIHQSQSDTTHQLTAAATVLAPSLDKRPTRSELDGVLAGFLDAGFLINHIAAAGYVRDDPAPSVPKFETVADAEAYLSQRDIPWSITRYPESLWTASIPGHYCNDYPTQLEALNAIITAISKATP